MAIAKARNKAREEADSYMPIMASLESTITTDVSVSLSGTTPVVIVRSLKVACSISLPSDSVVVVGSFTVTIVVAQVVKIEPSGVVGLLSVVVLAGCVCTLTSLGVVAFSSSAVGRGDVFAAIVVVDGL